MKFRDHIICTCIGVLGVTLPAILVTHFVGAAYSNVVLIGSLVSFVVGLAGGTWLALTETEWFDGFKRSGQSEE